MTHGNHVSFIDFDWTCFQKPNKVSGPFGYQALWSPSFALGVIRKHM